MRNLLLLARAARLRKGIVRVANPATGKIPPVVRIAAPRHSDFIAVINLGIPRSVR